MFARRLFVQVGPLIFCFAIVQPAVAQDQVVRDEPAVTPPAPSTGSENLPSPVGPSPVASSSASSAPPTFDFFADDKDATGSHQDVDRVAAAASLRRSRLHTHQTLGLITWGLMATTAIVGQLNYNDVYGSGGGRTGNYLWPHRLLGYATAATFATAAAYALLAPTPYKRPLKLDSSLVHRIAAVGATLGMVAQVALGFYTGRKADAGNSSGLQTDAQAHLAIGYATLGFLTIAGVAWVF
jgi:hypothetical protein